MMNKKTETSAKDHQAGFTLMELVVSLIVLAEILVGALLLFDVNTKLARVQIQVTDMQQALRVSQHDMVRMSRMAGRGPFPLGGLPDGLAVGVVDTAPKDTTVAVGDPEGNSPIVVENTDVLRIRGVISSPLYSVDFTDTTAYTIDADAATIKVDNVATIGVPQDLKALKDAIDDNLPEAILVVSRADESVYAIGELLPSDSTYVEADGEATSVTLSIDFGVPASAASKADQYLALSPNGSFPAQLQTVSFVGILEEYKYYIREDYVVEGDPSSELTPKFARARLFPGTETGYGKDAAARTKSLEGDLADNVLDFQVALGLDADDNDSIEDAEWIFSDPNAPAGPAFLGNLHYLRVNLLVRTDRRDFEYEAEDLTAIENHEYDTDSPENTRGEKMYRRRVIQTIVQLRNL